MQTIAKNVKNEIIIKKSRFITLLFKVNSIDDIDEYLSIAKKEYKDANHYCYAYIINNYSKCSDDKEPSKTAGVPILNVLMKNDLTNILAIVVRYFGGIKLGAGPLTRAYSSSVSSALKETNIIDNIIYKTFEFDIDYENNNKIMNVLEKCIIMEKIFDKKIHYKIKIDEKSYDTILNILKEYI